ncbi:unnamed protein product [Rotaria sp. Silwood2]|nr:unnamed protein product [Rotaria sp. Silwood2]
MPRKFVKKNLKKYHDAEFKSAMNAIKNGASIRQAAKDFHVPYTTLCSHAGAHVISGSSWYVQGVKVQGGTGGKSFTSALVCASATGEILPPFVVYRSKRLFQEWCLGAPPNTGFSNTESGWMEKTVFYDWFKEMFLEITKNLPRPVLLILDGHKSHFMVETLELAVKNEVIILCLPPHATHLLQPLDCVFFSAAKTEWKKILKNEYRLTHNNTVGKVRFPALLSQLWATNAIKQKTNIVKSFMKTGIFPLNPTSIDWSKILQDKTSMDISSSTDATTTCFNDQMNKSNSRSIFNISNVPDNNNDSSITDPSINNILIPTATITSDFDSSPQAISALDRVLDETTLDNYDEDEDYLPNCSISTSMHTMTLSNNRQSRSKRKSTSQHQQSITLQPSYRSKKIRPKVIGIDTSDEEGCMIFFLLL